MAQLTPKTVTDLLTLIRAGTTVRGACGVARVGKSTFYEWLKQGRAAKAKHEGGEQLNEHEALAKQLVDDLEVAEAEAEARHVKNILTKATAADGDWRASAWWLERRRPEDYAKVFNESEIREVVRHAMDEWNQKLVKIVNKHCSPEVAALIVEELKRLAPRQRKDEAS